MSERDNSQSKFFGSYMVIIHVLALIGIIYMLRDILA